MVPVQKVYPPEPLYRFTHLWPKFQVHKGATQRRMLRGVAEGIGPNTDHAVAGAEGCVNCVPVFVEFEGYEFGWSMRSRWSGSRGFTPDIIWMAFGQPAGARLVGELLLGQEQLVAVSVDIAPAVAGDVGGGSIQKRGRTRRAR